MKRTLALRILSCSVLPFSVLLSYFISLFQTFLISAPTHFLFRFPPIFFPCPVLPTIVWYIVHNFCISELHQHSHVTTELSTSLTRVSFCSGCMLNADRHILVFACFSNMVPVKSRSRLAPFFFMHFCPLDKSTQLHWPWWTDDPHYSLTGLLNSVLRDEDKYTYKQDENDVTHGTAH